MVTMKKGAVLQWVLKGFRGDGYVTAHNVTSPPALGCCFNRARLFIVGLRLDLVSKSWWARMDPRSWFQPRVYIESYRLFEGEPTESCPTVAVHDRSFVRCNPRLVRQARGDRPAETFKVGLHPEDLVIDQWDERNSHSIFHVWGLASCYVRRLPFPGAVFYIPGSGPDAQVYRAAVVRTLTADEDVRMME
jgi:site-specific DNA-cytosine methylase